MKMNIEITKIGTKFLETDKTIADIDICNGNWKINEDWMETYDKIPLTINTIGKSRYLTLPVKDAYPFYNKEALIERNECIVEDAMVRPYDSLLEFLNCRINNAKEDFKKFKWWNERTFTCVLFDSKIRPSRDEDITGEFVYENKALLEIKITRVTE